MYRIRFSRNISLVQKENILKNKTLNGSFKIHAGKRVFITVPYLLYLTEKRLTKNFIKTILTIEVRLISFLIVLGVVFFSSFMIAYLIYGNILLVFAILLPTCILYISFYFSAAKMAEEKLNSIVWK